MFNDVLKSLYKSIESIESLDTGNLLGTIIYYCFSVSFSLRPYVWQIYSMIVVYIA